MDHHLTPALPLPEPQRQGLYRAIYTRRDTRGEFLPDPIDEDVLVRILMAAHHAPSVGYMQPWSFLLVRDLDIRRQVHAAFVQAHAEATAMFPAEQQSVYSRLKLEGILDAPLNICITCDRDRAGPVVIGRTHIPTMDVYSSVCAVQNLWLAARAEGLGVGWVSIFDNEVVRKILGIPENIIPIAYLCIGHVQGYFHQPELQVKGWRQRLPLKDLLHFDQWGQQTGEDHLKTSLDLHQSDIRHFFSDPDPHSKG